MIFVYPAIVSDTVDAKIGTAVCRTLEQYFLLHLQEAFQNRNIGIRTVWNGKGYGPLQVVAENATKAGKVLLESSNPDHKRELSSSNKLISDALPVADMDEASDLHDAWKEIFDNDVKAVTKQNSIPVDPSTFSTYDAATAKTTSGVLKDKLAELEDLLAFIEIQQQQISTNLINRMPDKGFASNHRKELVRYQNLYEIMRNQLRSTIERIKRYRQDLDGIAKGEKSGKFDSEKEAREKEKFETEKGAKDAAQYETHGQYKVEAMKGVSLKPTMANMQVRIEYRGGPHEKYGTVTSPSGMFQEIAIGAKVLPLRISNFGRLEDAILDDYFTTKFQATWKRYSRDFLRKALGWFRTNIKQFAGSDLTDNMDPIKANILLSPKGYINSSSFETNSDSSSFYHYSAAMVIMDKMDLVKDPDANFILNKTQLAKMFKMGWNSFCILDHNKEEAMFVSTLDGGNLHVIPYAYIFNQLGMDQIYQNINDLHKRSGVMRMSKGNLGTLMGRLRRESRLLETVRRLLGK